MKKQVDLILLIDDDVDDNFFHKRVIEKSGWAKKVIECLDGQDALDYLKNEGQYQKEAKKYPQPDLIFLDINMPRMDGWTFLEHYQSCPPEVKGGPIVAMLTTSVNPKDIERAKQYDIVKDYMNKPLTKAMLETIFEKHL